MESRRVSKKIYSILAACAFLFCVLWRGIYVSGIAMFPGWNLVIQLIAFVSISVLVMFVKNRKVLVAPFAVLMVLAVISFLQSISFSLDYLKIMSVEDLLKNILPILAYIYLIVMVVVDNVPILKILWFIPAILYGISVLAEIYNLVVLVRLIELEVAMSSIWVNNITTNILITVSILFMGLTIGKEE